MEQDRQGQRLRFEALLGTPATDGNAVDVLRNGDAIFPAMLDAIRGAERAVDLLTYAYWRGWPTRAFAEALAERSRAGCQVRLLVDALGGSRMDLGLADRMRRDGVDVQFFRQPWLRSPFAHNHRTHRKVLVVDGQVAFTGGVGIAEEWQGDAREPSQWRDTQIRVRGPAVAGLRAAFVQNWSETVGMVDDGADAYPALPSVGDHVVQVVRGTATVGWDDIETAWYGMLTAAQSRITVQTAYFAPDEEFQQLLQDAVGRGVRVQVLLPGPHYDKALSRLASQRHFADLLAAGVQVWRYQPTMLHTKIVTVDDGALAMIGSSNLNRRSLDHDEEVVCILHGGAAARELVQQFEQDLQRAERVSPDRWQDRGIGERLAEQALRPVSRYL